MAVWSKDGQTLSADVHKQRIAAGTLGGEYATPGSLNGRSLTSIVSPFDPRLSYGGAWTLDVGLDANDFLGENMLGTAIGDTVTLAFSGTSVSVIGRTVSYGGRADVYVDGALQGGRVNTFTFLSASYALAGLNSSDTSIAVSSTTSFSSSGSIQIDGEVISYTSVDATHFLGCTRAASSTVASTHLTGTTVYQYSSMIEGYSVKQQPRVTMWSSNTLPPGQHTLQLVVRSDTNGSATANTLYLNCFVIGGAIGASNLITHNDYVVYPSVSFTSGASSINSTLTSNTTDQQTLGIIGAVAVTGGNTYWCGVAANPVNGTIGFYSPQVGTASADVTITVSVLGAPL